MSFQKSESTPKICPKTGKIISSDGFDPRQLNSRAGKLTADRKFHWFWWFLPFTGLAALIWFLIRVIPKPSRALYPCQKVALPLASGFVVWLLGLAGSAIAYQKAKRHIARARYVLAAICITASVAFIWMAMSVDTNNLPIILADEPLPPNAPIGDAKGIHPGRVAWIYDPNVANWTGSDGNNNQPFWHDNVCTNQQVASEMFSKGLRALTGEYSDSDAWDSLFRYFNQQQGRGDVGYSAGEKIAIKVNFVLMNNNPSSGDKPNGPPSTYYYMDQIDNSPQLTIALLKQLIDVVGVSPGDISIGDPLMEMPNHWYNMVVAECPGVVYLTKSTLSLPGRTQITLDNTAPFYWSDPVTSRVTGKTQDYIPTHFSQSNYFINFATLKSHTQNGITVCAKNHYGSLARLPTTGGSTYYDMHATRALETPGMGHYRATVDLMCHPKLGGKTLLYLVDGFYSGRGWDSHTIRWQMAPFGGDWPSSVFLSQDPVAIDSVAFDFMHYEWDDVSGLSSFPQMSGTEDYLHEAAQIPNPPSDANYDPNHDGSITESLGVHEHWNNVTNKQYSRNLDPVNGTGIELVTAPPSDDPNINFVDFAEFAQAWGSSTGQPNWDADWDISIPADGNINGLDLAVFCESWLGTLITDLIEPGATLVEAYSATDIKFEGPTWDPNSHKLFFTRRTAPYQILRLNSPGNVTVWMNPSLETNGMIISLDGRLLACDENPMQVSSRRIDVGGPNDTLILADTSDGFTKKPNDLCQLANGNIYFTTPDWGENPPSAQGVFLLEPNGTVIKVKSGLYQPNGIITSLDETKLYVSEGSTNTTYQRWWVYNINSNGTLDAGSVFFKPSSPPDTGNVPDGMTIDELGNLYFTGLGGVWIVSPQGTQIDFVTVYAPANIAFGGPDGKTLYITAKGKVYSLAMCVRGGESSSW